MIVRAARISSNSAKAMSFPIKSEKHLRNVMPAISNQFFSTFVGTCRSQQTFQKVECRLLSTLEVKQTPKLVTDALKGESLEKQTLFAPTQERKYEFFQNVEITNEGIAIIRFDNPNKKVNTISFKLKDEAEKLWEDEIHSNSSVKGVVFSSAKPDSFIAGADIFDIQSLENKEDVIPLIESATKFFHHIKSKGIPLVCAINGPALGGGLEWALWCDYRICTDSTKTKLGLPEVGMSTSLLLIFIDACLITFLGQARTATRFWGHSELT